MKLTSFSGMVLLESNLQAIHMDEKDMRYLIAWLVRNKPEIVSDIICEECPEKLEYEHYHINKCERGH